MRRTYRYLPILRAKADAVQREAFAQTVANVQARNADVPEAEIQGAIEDALRQVRAEM